MNFLLDENVDLSIRSAFVRRTPDHQMWIVGDPIAPPRGTSDPAILHWCAANSVVLVTYNRTSMPVHLRDHPAAGHHMPGIFILRPQTTITAIVEELLLITEAGQMGEFSDQITYLPL